ncbi:hypothetical protein LZ32DRAFT_645320 [Colletotrichum eremochloae]|nr:hypothetical protein LZ32DRAFT_645320 [Colletotrichum eremochloae]
MQLTKTLLFTLIGTAFASPIIEKRQAAQVIQTAVTSVQGAISKLDTAIKAVGDDINSAQPALTAATDLQSVITKAVADVQGAPPLQLQEALGLQQLATDLQGSATTLIDDIIAKKPNFDKLGVSNVVLDNLKQQKETTQNLGKGLISKVPAIGQGIAQQTIDGLTAIIDKGVQAYSSGAAADSTPAGSAPPAAKPGNGTAVLPAAAPATPKSPVNAATTPPATAPNTPAAAPAGGIGGLIGGLGGAGGLGSLLGGLTGGAAGGGASGAGGAGGLGSLLSGLGSLGGSLLGGLGSLGGASAGASGSAHAGVGKGGSGGKD